MVGYIRQLSGLLWRDHFPRRNAIGTYRARDVLKRPIAEVDKAKWHFAVNLIVGGTRNADPARLRDTLKPCRDVDTVPENVIALDQDVSKIDPDPKQHTPLPRDTFVPLVHGRLHGYRALDRIHHGRELKQHAVACGLHETPPMLRDEGIGDLAVFAESAGGADLIEAHEPRVASHVSGDYCR